MWFRQTVCQFWNLKAYPTRSVLNLLNLILLTKAWFILWENFSYLKKFYIFLIATILPNGTVLFSRKPGNELCSLWQKRQYLNRGLCSTPQSTLRTRQSACKYYIELFSKGHLGPTLLCRNQAWMDLVKGTYQAGHWLWIELRVIFSRLGRYHLTAASSWTLLDSNA